MSTNAERRLPASYVALWAALTTVAIAYLAGVAARPELIAQMIPTMRVATVSGDELDHRLEMSIAEREALRAELTQARADLGTLRTELARRADDEAALLQRIAAAESREVELASELARTRSAASANTERAALSQRVDETAAAEGAARAAAQRIGRSLADSGPSQVAAQTPPQMRETVEPRGRFQLKAPTVVGTIPIAGAQPAQPAPPPRQIVLGPPPPEPLRKPQRPVPPRKTGEAAPTAAARPAAPAPVIDDAEAIILKAKAAAANTQQTTAAPAAPPSAWNPFAGATKRDSTPLETGTVADALRAVQAAPPPNTPRVTFGAPAISPSGSGDHAVILGTGPSVDALRLTWALIAERGPTSVGGLQPRYMASATAPAGGKAFDLLAGPLPDAAAAKRVCEDLRAQKVLCSVGKYGGSAL